MNYLGITGSRMGCSPKQLSTVGTLLKIWSKVAKYPTLVHGCCIGVDEEIVELAHLLDYNIIGHPPINKSFISQRSIELSNHLMEPKEFIGRNRNIVDDSDIVIGVPTTYKEVVRSGTWATIRAAKRRNRLIIIIWPDGSMEIPETK